MAPARPAIDPKYARYVPAPKYLKQRLITANVGEPGSGKTGWWFRGAPCPIICLSLNKGYEGVVEEQVKLGREIYLREFEWAPAPGVEMDQQAVIEMREDFTATFEDACKPGMCRSLFVDLETEMWDLFKYAEFGPERAGVPKNWESLKQRVRRLINMPKGTDLNFGLLQSMGNEWVPQVNPKSGARGIAQTGKRIRKGMDDVESLVHINMEHSAYRNAKGDQVFAYNVGKSRGPGAPDVQNETFENVTFPEFGQLVFPDSLVTDWE